MWSRNGGIRVSQVHNMETQRCPYGEGGGGGADAIFLWTHICIKGLLTF